MSESTARPIHPYVVLVLALLLPGVGNIAIGEARRGLVFAFFTLLFGLLTLQFSTAEQSFIGRHAAGFFVWALSVPDAYRRARLAYVMAQGRTGSSLS